ncbi:patatin-like phospholipase [Aspergillus sclerotioniger CBS 115572]|uniref:Patatin-like phospholipase n=1 Tax=Aspergillus sclerotioniger CBS 115572 TaxID=1450535 RepID=A0A317XBY8_9EURO|nr:patatin-like phospholipase [Aspergillus sclerotioniger CBS 115572]PWY96029.1 patatin-like phospholipase [Aspergillus sclerotioniger CBS 115572]
MRRTEDIGWLDVGLAEDGRFIIHDHNRLTQTLGMLPNPDSQIPSLCLFLGAVSKDKALQQIFPQNNIRRHKSGSVIGLRYDITSLDSPTPILFADGDPQLNPIPGKRPELGVSYPVIWDAATAKAVLHVLWCRLMFIFADVVCIFADDFASFSELVEFLIECLVGPSASSLPSAVRPRLVVVLASGLDVSKETMLTEQLYGQNGRTSSRSLGGAFSSINMIRLGDTCLSERVRHERLRALVQGQLADMQLVRHDHRAQFTALHLDGLFQSALRHIATHVDHPFNFIRATRETRKIPPNIIDHLAHYCEIGQSAGYTYDELAPTIASTLLMDFYIPGAVVYEPRSVFRTLYRTSVLRGICAFMHGALKVATDDLLGLIECNMVYLFDKLEREAIDSATLRKQELLSYRGRLCRLRSTRICLYCLLHTAQHSLSCGHTICDICAQVFGRPATDADYQFTITECLYCLYKSPLVVDVLPPTMNPTILAIDGGGVRGVIPLEFLILVQEKLGPSCSIHELIDLGIGTSSVGGLSILGLLKMGWDVQTCSTVFESLARRIFQSRRSSSLSQSLRSNSGGRYLISCFHKWLLWLLYDGCYDSHVFDSALKEAFGEQTRLFDSRAHISSRQSSSGTRLGVVAASIAKNTRSFIFGNFNTPEIVKDGCIKCTQLPCNCEPSNIEARDLNIIRPAQADLEPSIWEAARATAAAPFFFPPAYIRGIGSFQDGGLTDNFAADIARRLCRQIWPSRKQPARLLSLGTGRMSQTSDKSPQFRHVFRDGFLRRGFDAWMSSMDTEPKWQAMISHLDPIQREAYTRFNVQLQDIPDSIDNIDTMDEYRNLVILQPGSARLAKDIAIGWLVARFYFVLDLMPETTTAPFWCHGTIRCKGNATHIVAALQSLWSQRVDFTTDTDALGRFNGLEDICSACMRYRKPVSVLVHHLEETVNIHLRAGTQRHWRINGFPECMQSFIAKQELRTVFGRTAHDCPTAAACSECDSYEISLRGKRRKRDSELSHSGQRNKRVCVDVGQFRAD